MLSTILKIPKYIIFRKFNWPRVLPANITISVTDWCNSRCKTCNIWMLRPKNEFSLEEYEKTFSKYNNRVFWITVTGGEPFLRTDLVDIIKIVNGKTKPKYMTIPSHGMFTDKVTSSVQEILESCPNINLIVNLSLDAVGEQHDNIRGVVGNFQKTKTTFEELKKIKNKRLTIGINSVISKFNVENFTEIYTKILEMNPDSYISEIAENRANLYNSDLNITPRTNDYGKILQFIIRDLEKKRRNDTGELVRKLRVEFYKYLATGRFPTNYEGIASAYLMASGEVWVSHSRHYVIGNLRDVDYDFRKIWFSKKANKFRLLMKESNYSSMLANAFYTNVMCSPKELLRILLN